MSKQIGLLLVREKVLTRETLDEVAQNSAASGSDLVTGLLDRAIMDDNQLAHFISEKLSVPLADRRQLQTISASIVNSLAKDLADEFSAVPLGSDRDQLKVAFIDPTDQVSIKELEFYVGKKIFPMVASRQAVHEALNRYYHLKRKEISDESAGISRQQSQLDEAVQIPQAVPFVAPEPMAPPPPVPTPTYTPRSYQESPALITPPPPAELKPSIPIPAVKRPPPIEGGFPAMQKPFPTPAPRIPTASRLSETQLDQLHKQTLQKLDQAQTKEQIADYFLDFATKVLRRVALFTIKKNVLMGWEGKGEDFDQRNLKGIMIPLNSPSLFQRVKDSKVYYFGEVPNSTVNQIFLTAIGSLQPPNVLLIPLTIREKVFGIFYGDSAPDTIQPNLLHFLHLMVPKVESAFEALILKIKKGQ